MYVINSKVAVNVTSLEGIVKLSVADVFSVSLNVIPTATHSLNLFPSGATAVAVIDSPGVTNLLTLAAPSFTVKVYCINSQFAVYALSPVLPVGIVTVSVASVNPVPVQPTNVCPALVGLFKVTVSSIV